MYRTHLMALAVALVFLLACFLPVRPAPHCWPTDSSTNTTFDRD